ncbi:MAG: type IV pili methyl-accepting chemotaxis transducer N-terminal domain-containing protein [Pseudomonadota bacterium]
MKLFKILILTLSFFALQTTAVDAQTAEEFGTVINLSGKQRMLTQKMSKEVMLVALDIDKEKNLKNLQATSSLFDKTLKGLRNGDADLKLPATTSPKIIRQLDRVEKLWTDFYPIVQNVIDTGSATADDVSAIAGSNLKLLKQMNKAVGAYEKEAAATGLSAAPGLATTLNLSGKQRMLTQKMSKEFLLVAYNHEKSENKLNLLETFTLFERTLQGLKVGDDTLGLPPTKDTAILNQLDKVSSLWDKAKPSFVSATAKTEAISTDDKNTIAALNLPLLKEMNAAVQMYEGLTK